FRVSIDGLELHISSNDIQHAFGLCEPVSPNALFIEWPPVLDRFPPKWEIEEELLFTGKKKGSYLRRKNLSYPICLFHMIAHRNIIPQVRNKNVLVRYMLYLAYIIHKGHNVNLVHIIMHELILTANPIIQARTLPYNMFISQLLTLKGVCDS
ncbi:hypothetical protein GIB67_007580, partial [Kingdonia uniflora]